MSDEVMKAVDDLVGKRGYGRLPEEPAPEELERVALAEALRESGGIAHGRRYRHWQDRQSAAAWVRATRETQSPS